MGEESNLGSRCEILDQDMGEVACMDLHPGRAAQNHIAKCQLKG